MNKALSVLRQAFKEAVIQQALEKNPVDGIAVKGADKRAQSRDCFTFEQFRELVRRTGPDEKSARGYTVDPDWQTFILVGGYTGGRQQEVAQLRWEHVDFDKGMLGLQRTKSGTDEKPDIHWVPMHASLITHLQARQKEKKKSTSPFVMPHLADMAERMLSKIFREIILPRIGISQPYSKHSAEKGVGRKLAQYSIHSLRHSLVTWLNEAGVPEMMRMRLVGHEDQKVSWKYTHTQMQEASVAMAKVPSV